MTIGEWIGLGLLSITVGCGLFAIVIALALLFDLAGYIEDLREGRLPRRRRRRRARTGKAPRKPRG